MANGSAYYKQGAVKLGVPGGSAGLAPLPGASVWKAGAAYGVGAYVVNGGHVYQNQGAAGTSAAAGVGPTPGALVDNTVTWTYIQSLGGFYSSDVAPVVALGTCVQGVDSGPNAYGEAEFVYVKFTGAAAIKAGDHVVIDRAGQTAVGTPAAAPGANKTSVIGIAMANQALNVATPTYGWVMTRGVFDGANVITTFTAGATMSGGAGVGAGTANAAVPIASYIFDGEVLRSGAAAYLCTVELLWPVCSGR